VSAGRCVWVAAAVAALAGVAVWLVSAPPAVALSTGDEIPEKITFTGSGTMTVEETYVDPASICELTTHDTMALSWTAVFYGSISANGVFGLDSNVGSLEKGPGTFSIDTKDQLGPGGKEIVAGGGPEPPCAAQVIPSCQGALPSPAPPTFEVVLGDGEIEYHMVFDAQSATPGPFDAACPNPAKIEAENDVSVLESALPGALTGHGEIPPEALVKSNSVSVPVSYSSAPTQVPTSCSGTKKAINPYITNTGCNASISWNGTVTVAADCGSKNQASNCFDKKTKEEAQKSLEDLAPQTNDDRINYQVNCTGANLELSKMIDKGGGTMCIMMKATWKSDLREERHLKEVVNDPPSSAYTKVAKPHRAKIKRAGVLRRHFPASYRWLEAKLKIEALTGALMTSQNRSSGAAAALGGGDQSAAGPLAKQDKAVLSYAKQAAHLLRHQPLLARRASHELRHVAGGLHGRTRRLAKGIRRFAAGLVSKHARGADRHAAAALRGIGG
jgi:hypothetical protein